MRRLVTLSVSAIPLQPLFDPIATAPAGDPSGTLHLRVVSPDQPDSLEACISLALSPLFQDADPANDYMGLTPAICIGRCG